MNLLFPLTRLLYGNRGMKFAVIDRNEAHDNPSFTKIGVCLSEITNVPECIRKSFRTVAKPDPLKGAA